MYTLAFLLLQKKSLIRTRDIIPWGKSLRSTARTPVKNIDTAGDIRAFHSAVIEAQSPAEKKRQMELDL